MVTRTGSPTHLSNEEGREFFAEVDRYLQRTRTYFVSLCEKAEVPVHCRSNVVRGGNGLAKETALILIKTIEAHPDGVPYVRPTSAGKPSKPKRVADAVPKNLLSEEELRRRRDEVSQQREARAMAHLQSEKPGFNGKRAFSMRPVWEQPA